MGSAGVSVIVCCYNSSVRIAETLKYLSVQETPVDFKWEVILVDNASSDNTRGIASALWAEISPMNVPLRIVDQPLQGLSFARKKGIEESLYDVLIFCDDDNGLHSQYVATAWQIMKSNPKIGALGGCGVMTTGIPTWLKGLEEFYALGPQGEKSGDVTDIRGCLYGAGLTTSKKVLHQLDQRKFRSILSDRTKNSLLSGGDTELTFAIRMLGYRLWYDERLKFEHFISQTRINKHYFIRLIFYIGYSWMALLPYHRVFNKDKVKSSSPDWIDILYILKNVGSSFLLSFVELLTLRFPSFRKKIFNTVFHVGELYFAIQHYGYYKSKSLFFLNGNINKILL